MPFGVAINGVLFDPGTAETWNGDHRWTYEALTGMMASQGSLGVDSNFAHVQPNGAYHYHGLPMGLLEKLNYRNKMVLVGYAADGYPIYGPYCYSIANDSSSALKMLRSSYRLKSGNRTGGGAGPGGAYDGSFASDYEYVKGLGDLDEFNGRSGVTPDYPRGTFYYVLTATWPFVPRTFRGTPDNSFRRNGGPPNQGFGRGGGNRPGGDYPPGGGANGFPPGRNFRPGGGPPFDGPPPGNGFRPGGPPGGGFRQNGQNDGFRPGGGPPPRDDNDQGQGGGPPGGRGGQQ